MLRKKKALNIVATNDREVEKDGQRLIKWEERKRVEKNNKVVDSERKDKKIETKLQNQTPSETLNLQNSIILFRIIN